MQVNIFLVITAVILMSIAGYLIFFRLGKK